MQVITRKELMKVHVIIIMNNKIFMASVMLCLSHIFQRKE